MTLVYTASTLFMATHMRNLLEAEGIACHMRNEFLGSGAGELPPTETWPEVWVVDDGQAERARALVADAMAAADAGEAWRCPACREEVDGNFGQCWKCGAVRPS